MPYAEKCNGKNRHYDKEKMGTIQVKHDRKLFYHTAAKFIFGTILIGPSVWFLLLFRAIPLILGSLISFPFFLVYQELLAKRLRNEEEVLEEGLEGYTAYKSG